MGVVFLGCVPYPYYNFIAVLYIHRAVAMLCIIALLWYYRPAIPQVGKISGVRKLEHDQEMKLEDWVVSPTAHVSYRREVSIWEENLSNDYFLDNRCRARCASQRLCEDNWGRARISQRAGIPDPWPEEGVRILYEAPVASSYIYIIDTGVRADHVEFGGRAMWGYTAPVAEEVERSLNFTDVHTDNNGHGTFMAGVAAGRRYGAAPHAKIISVKVFSATGFGSISDFVDSVEWVVQDARRHGRRAVISASLGIPFVLESVNQAVQAALNAGIPFVVAAGNEFRDACLGGPANMGGGNSSAITVGASNITDEYPSFANYGACVDIAAPGVDVTSAFNTNSTAYFTASGTSVATPFVAGIIARRMAIWKSDPASLKKYLLSEATQGKLTFRNPAAAVDTPNRLAYTPCAFRRIMCPA